MAPQDALAMDIALHKALKGDGANLRQIATRHDLTLPELRERLADPAFVEQVQMAESTAAYEKEAHKMRCASVAEMLLVDMVEMARDPGTPAAARAKIYELIIRDAGVSQKAEDEMGGTPIHINIDLSAGQASLVAPVKPALEHEGG